MDIVLIGSGNVATILGRKSLDAGHRIVQVYSPDKNHADLLAAKLGSISTSRISTLINDAALTIIAIRDEAVAPLAREIAHIKSVVAHTSGAVSINVLENISDSFGVLYPLQSLRKEIELLPPVPMLVDGNNAEATRLLKEFASGLSDKVFLANDKSRLEYHLAATIVNNFTNHLFALANSFCEKESISFTALQPLIEETVTRLRKQSPAAVQTGPAFRNDQLTLESHRRLLKEYPSLLEIYELFTKEIQKLKSNNES